MEVLGVVYLSVSKAQDAFFFSFLFCYESARRVVRACLCRRDFFVVVKIWRTYSSWIFGRVLAKLSYSIIVNACGLHGEIVGKIGRTEPFLSLG